MSMNQDLIVRCVLGVLLAASAGCATDGFGFDEDQAIARDQRALPREPQPADAGVNDSEDVGEFGQGSERRDGGFAWAAKDAEIDPPGDDQSCEVSPGEPTDAGLGKDAGIGKDPGFGKDAGIGTDPGVPPSKDPDAGLPVGPPTTPRSSCLMRARRAATSSSS
jgi:hypothetical protein